MLLVVFVAAAVVVAAVATATAASTADPVRNVKLLSFLCISVAARSRAKPIGCSRKSPLSTSNGAGRFFSRCFSSSISSSAKRNGTYNFSLIARHPNFSLTASTYSRSKISEANLTFSIAVLFFLFFSKYFFLNVFFSFKIDSCNFSMFFNIF